MALKDFVENVNKDKSQGSGAPSTVKAPSMGTPGTAGMTGSQVWRQYQAQRSQNPGNTMQTVGLTGSQVWRQYKAQKENAIQTGAAPANLSQQIFDRSGYARLMKDMAGLNRDLNAFVNGGFNQDTDQYASLKERAENMRQALKNQQSYFGKYGSNINPADLAGYQNNLKRWDAQLAGYGEALTGIKTGMYDTGYNDLMSSMNRFGAQLQTNPPDSLQALTDHKKQIAALQEQAGKVRTALTGVESPFLADQKRLLTSWDESLSALSTDADQRIAQEEQRLMAQQGEYIARAAARNPIDTPAEFAQEYKTLSDLQNDNSLDAYRRKAIAQARITSFFENDNRSLDDVRSELTTAIDVYTRLGSFGSEEYKKEISRTIETLKLQMEAAEAKYFMEDVLPYESSYAAGRTSDVVRKELDSVNETLDESEDIVETAAQDALFALTTLRMDVANAGDPGELALIDQAITAAQDALAGKYAPSLALDESILAIARERQPAIYEDLMRAFNAYAEALPTMREAKTQAAELETEQTALTYWTEIDTFKRDDFDAKSKPDSSVAEQVTKTEQQHISELSAAGVSVNEAASDNLDLVYVIANRLPGYEQLVDGAKLLREIDGAEYSITANDAQFMTEDQIRVFTYLYNTGRKDEAAEYLNGISGELAYRSATMLAESWDEFGLRFLYSMYSGFRNFASGVRANFTDGDEPYAAEDIAMGIISENHRDDFSQYTLAAGQSIGNMAPALLLGKFVGAKVALGNIGKSVGKTVGNVMFGLSSSGNAYKQAKAEGLTDYQARAYGLLVGASEVGLDYMLSGLGGLDGGKTLTWIQNKILPAVSSTLGKTALRLGGSIAGEVVEENLQNLLEPAFQMITGMAATYDGPDIEEIVDTTLSTILSTGLMNIKDSVSYGYNLKQWRKEAANTAEQWKELAGTIDSQNDNAKVALLIASDKLAALSKNPPADIKELQEQVKAIYVENAMSAAALLVEKAATSVPKEQQEAQQQAQTVQAANPNAAVIKDAAAQAYIDSKYVTPKVAQEAGSILAQAMETGKISDDGIKALHLETKWGADVASQMLGVKIPITREAAQQRTRFREALEKYIQTKVESVVATAENAAQQAQQRRAATVEPQAAATAQPQQTAPAAAVAEPDADMIMPEQTAPKASGQSFAQFKREFIRRDRANRKMSDAEIRKAWYAERNSKEAGGDVKLSVQTEAAPRTAPALPSSRLDDVNAEVRERVELLARTFGFDPEKISYEDLQTANGKWDIPSGRIILDINPVHNKAKDLFLFAIGHEVTHAMRQSMGATAWNELEAFAVKAMGGRDAITAKQKEHKSYREIAAAREELVCDWVGEVLSDKKALDDLVKAIEGGKVKRSPANGLRRAVSRVLNKLRGKTTEAEAKPGEAVTSRMQELYGTSIEEAEAALRRLTQAIKAAKGSEGKKNTTRAGESSAKNSMKSTREFMSELSEWRREDRPDGEVFILGSTGDVLQGLGAIESDVFLRSEKINTILQEHPEMTLDEISKIPQILDDPILILKSRNVSHGARVNSRMVIFGSVKAKNGLPVLTVLDLHPVENRLAIEDMQKVTSAYTKNSNPVRFVENSDVLYADKKRATRLLKTIGFQNAYRIETGGYVGNISYIAQEVNMSGEPFSDVFSEVEDGEGQKNEEPSTRRTLHADVNQTGDAGEANAQLFNPSVAETDDIVKGGAEQNLSEVDANNAGLSVESKSEMRYTKGRRSERAQAAIDRAAAGESNTIEALLRIPEVASTIAEERQALINGPLAPREDIVSDGTSKALQLGSWDGKGWNGPIKTDRRADIVIGLPGSGKSSVYSEPLSQEHGSRLIDTDEYRGYTPEYNGRNAAVYHEEASAIKKRVQAEALARGENIILSVLGDDAVKMRKTVEGLRSKGYQVYLHLNELPNAKAIGRALSRYIRADGSLGRYVPIERLYALGDAPTQTYLALTRGESGNDQREVSGNQGLDEGRGSAEENRRGLDRGRSVHGKVLADSGRAGNGRAERVHLSGWDWYNNDVPFGEKPRLIESSDSMDTDRKLSVKPGVFEFAPDDEAATIPMGEQPRARDSYIPESMEEGTKVRRTARTAYEAGVTNEAVLPKIDEALVRGRFNLKSDTNKKQVDRATKWLRTQAKNNISLESVSRTWIGEASGKVDANTVARGAVLYNELATAAQNEQDPKARKRLQEAAVDVLERLARVETDAARALQAAQIMKRLTPSMRYYALQKSLSALNSQIALRTKGEIFEVKADPDLVEEWVNAIQSGDETLADSVAKDLYRNIAEQVPKSFADRFNAWRYLSMLGNPKTIIRNTIGNAAMTVMRQISTNLNALGQLLFIRDRKKRTASFASTPRIWLTEKGRELRRYALDDFELIRDEIAGNGKYNESSAESQLAKAIDDAKRQFKMAGLKQWQKATNYLMEDSIIGDQGFMQRHYTSAFVSACMARGYSAEEISKGTIPASEVDKVRAFAVRQAQRATFRDKNWFSKTLRKANFTPQTLAGKIGKMAVDGFIPFRSTPANVLARAIDYSPIGLVNGVVQLVEMAVQHRKKGDVENPITGAQILETFADGVTGTGLFVLGLLLQSAGILKVVGSIDDEDEERKGRQSYALEVGDTSITLDWLAPAAIPFFMGAEISAASEKSDSSGIQAFVDAVGQMFDPMLEMSMLSGVQDALSTIGSDPKISDIILGLGIQPFFSYVGQTIPTLLSQVSQTVEAYQGKNEYTYTGDIEGTFVRTVVKAAAKLVEKLPGDIFGWSWRQTEWVDDWGRTEEPVDEWYTPILNSFLNPAYVSDIIITEPDVEIDRLETATGENHGPSRRPYTITVKELVNGEEVSREVRLTASQYDIYSRVYGENALAMLTALMQTSYYANLSDKDKSKALDSVLTLANELGKAAALPGEYNPELSTQDQKLYGLVVDAGMSGVDAYIAKLVHSQIEDDETYTGAPDRMRAYSEWLANQPWDDVTKAAVHEAYGTYFTHIPGNVDNYNEMLTSGLAEGTADMVMDAISALEPVEGKTSVSDLQRWSEILNIEGLDGEQINAAVRAYMTEEQRAKLDQYNKAGISTTEYVQIRKAIGALKPLGDAKSVSYTQEMIEISRMRSLTEAQRYSAMSLNLSKDSTAMRETLAAAQKAHIPAAAFASAIGTCNSYDAKDAAGNSVNGLKKWRIAEYIRKLNLSDAQKDVIWKHYYDPADSKTWVSWKDVEKP